MAGPPPTRTEPSALEVASPLERAQADDASGGPRAREVLDEQPLRRVVGQRLAERVGARRWERAPVVCCSERIFARCELADPWDPSAADRPIAVGPVGMRFEERRQPAPHARVKEPKKPPSPQQAWTPPTGIPQAAPKPAVAKPAAAKPAAAKPAAPQPVRRPAPSAPEPAEPAPGRTLPPVKPPPSGGKPSTGRFRMRSTSATGPKVRPIPVVAVPSAPEPEEPAAASAPEPPAPLPKPQPQGLDDLFGSLGQGGRDKRMGRRK